MFQALMELLNLVALLFIISLGMLLIFIQIFGGNASYESEGLIPKIKKYMKERKELKILLNKLNNKKKGD